MFTFSTQLKQCFKVACITSNITVIIANISQGLFLRLLLLSGFSRVLFRSSFNFMAAVNICSDFGAPKNKVRA